MSNYMLKVSNENSRTRCFIAVNKTEGVFEHSGIFEACFVEAHQFISTFL